MQNTPKRTSTAVRVAAAALAAVLSLLGVSQAVGGPAVVTADRPWCC